MRIKQLLTTLTLTCIVASSLYSKENTKQEQITVLYQLYDSLENIEYVDSAITITTNNSIKPSINLAHIYRIKGEIEIREGNDVEAHFYLYKAINTYNTLKDANKNEWIIKCYYSIASSYLKQNDINGLKNILTEMAKLARDKNISSTVSYFYNSAQMIYCGTLINTRGRESIVDTMLYYAKVAVSNLQRIPTEKLKRLKISPTNIYYNIAVAHFLCFEPKQVDSTMYYLNIVKNRLHLFDDKKQQLKAEISMHNILAWAYLYEGKYNLARRNIEKMIAVVEHADSNSVKSNLDAKEDALKFYVEYYEGTDSLAKALESQKLLNKLSREIYNNENNLALNKLHSKYDIERKQAEIAKLSRENSIMKLSIFIIVILVVVLILTIFLIIIGKKNKEQKQYEAALEADSHLESQNLTVLIILEKLINDYPDYADKFRTVNIDHIIRIRKEANIVLTLMDLRYIICFMAGIKTDVIAQMFTVEQSTVYCVKYRIKKKFKPENQLF